MKSTIIFLFFMFCTSTLWAQAADSIFKTMLKEEIPTYILTPENEHIIYLKMSFASEEVPEQSIISALQNRKITHIDIVYTDFPKNRNFDKLNTNRIKKMLGFIPELVNQKSIIWKLVRQTDTKNYNHAIQMFHGVAVKFEEEKITSKTLVNREIEKVKNYVYNGNFKDSVVFKVMERNKKKWKNAVIVSDWTGSIYPFSSQILNWHKLNMKNNHNPIKYFVFFNDGDDKKDKEKKIGDTGGIYFTKTNEIAHVLEVMIQALQNGGGGDVPENDIEAILAGIDKYKDIEEVVLIADNNSPIRDIKLTPKITKPVRVILCGVDGGRINPQYVNLAKYTKGSIHTIEEDIDNLASMQPNDILKIGSRIFRLKPNGFFMMVK
jgi:hypothetical protein